MIPAHELRRLQDIAGDLDQLVQQRLAGEPLQYLEGNVQFGPIQVSVDHRVLIPRPETEFMWELAARTLGEAGAGTVIVDLCTGSGALALALKHRFPTARVLGTDLSVEALELAAANGLKLGLDVEWLAGDLFDALPQELKGRVDLLTSNPPYVAEAEYRQLPTDVQQEPYEALVAGPNGTEVIERIADDVYWWLGIGGWVFCEIGEEQGNVAKAQFGRWLDSDIHQDLTGKDRILVGRKGASCCL